MADFPIPDRAVEAVVIARRGYRPVRELDHAEMCVDVAAELAAALEASGGVLGLTACWG